MAKDGQPILETTMKDERIYDVETAHAVAISWNYYYDEPRMDEDEDESDGDYTGCESYYWSMSS